MSNRLLAKAIIIAARIIHRGLVIAAYVAAETHVQATERFKWDTAEMSVDQDKRERRNWATRQALCPKDDIDEDIATDLW